jgi:hypothetical protein
VEGGDGLIQGLGDGGNGGGAHHRAEQLGEDWADLASTEATEEDAADQFIDVPRAVLVAGEDRGPKAPAAGPGNLQIPNGAPGGRELAHIHAVAIPAAVATPDVIAGVEVLPQLRMHPVLQQELHRPERLPRDVTPQGGGVLDLFPQIGYRELGQWSHTGHGCIPPLSGWRWIEVGIRPLSFGPCILHRPPYTTL